MCSQIKTHGSPQLRSSDCERSRLTGSRGMSSPSLSQWFGNSLHVGDGNGFRRNCGLGDGRYMRLLVHESLSSSLCSSLESVGDLFCGESCKVPLPCFPLSPFLPDHFAHLPFLPVVPFLPLPPLPLPLSPLPFWRRASSILIRPAQTWCLPFSPASPMPLPLPLPNRPSRSTYAGAFVSQ